MSEGKIIVEWDFLAGEAHDEGISLEEMVIDLEKDSDFLIVGRPDLCPECGRPEAQHVWVDLLEFELWGPEPGEVKRYCATRTAEECFKDPLSGTGSHKIFSPAEAPADPCNVGYMKDIST